MKASVQINQGIESLFGTRDENIRLIESGLGVSASLLDSFIEIQGDEPNVSRAERILEDYAALVREGHIFTNGDLNSYFRVGPAGTGKTYLAVAMAISALIGKKVSRIILTRPAVEAGERLGFLPGTLQEKVDPYLRPLYDALYDLMEPERV